MTRLCYNTNDVKSAVDTRAPDVKHRQCVRFSCEAAPWVCLGLVCTCTCANQCYLLPADLSIALRHAGLCLNGGELQLLARQWPTVHSDQVDVLALVQAIEKAFCTDY